MKYRTSAEAAAAFLREHGHETRHGRRRKPPAQRKADRWVKRIAEARAGERIVVDLARATVIELLDCVSERILRHDAAGTEPEHITNVAWQMMNDALYGPEDWKCASCGGVRFVDAVDNHGKVYRGCANCRVRVPE